jgi:hypothetical protein
MNNTPSKQKFVFMSMNDDTYKIYTTSGKVIGVKNDSCNDRDEIVQTACNDNMVSQKWHFRLSAGFLQAPDCLKTRVMQGISVFLCIFVLCNAAGFISLHEYSA